MIQNPNELESEILPVMDEENRPAELSLAPGVDNNESNAEGMVFTHFSLVNHVATMQSM